MIGADWTGSFGYGDGAGLGVDALPLRYGPPPFAELPTVIGIRDTPPSAPAVYVIHGSGPEPTRRVLKGRDGHPGPKILSRHRAPGQVETDPTPVHHGWPDGPRIIHLKVPRGS